MEVSDGIVECAVATSIIANERSSHSNLAALSFRICYESQEDLLVHSPKYGSRLAGISRGSLAEIAKRTPRVAGSLRFAAALYHTLCRGLTFPLYGARP